MEISSTLTRIFILVRFFLAHASAVSVYLFSSCLLFCASVSANTLFSGQYIADNRPSDISFISITQTGQHVFGFMEAVTVVGQGESEKYSVEFDGIASGNNIEMEEQLTRQIRLSGHIDIDNLIISFTDGVGALNSLTFSKISGEEYQSTISAWEKANKEQYIEHMNLVSKSEALAEKYIRIEKTGIPDLVTTAKNALTEQARVASTYQHLRETFRSYSARISSNSCVFVESKLARLVREGMEGAIHNKFEVLDARFRAAEQDLRKRIIKVPSVIRSARSERREIDTMMANRQYEALEYPVLPILPVEVDALLGRYAKAANRAAKAIHLINERYNMLTDDIQGTLSYGRDSLKKLQRTCK